MIVLEKTNKSIIADSASVGKSGFRIFSIGAQVQPDSGCVRYDLKSGSAKMVSLRNAPFCTGGVMT